MSQVHHKPGVQEAFLVKRHLKLEALSAEQATTIAQAIGDLAGVDNVMLDRQSLHLDIAYDASKLNIDQVEAIIREHGGQLDHGWWTHFKEGWYRFTDQNIQDNARFEPSCCNKLPPRK